jgi:hypothetical protein
MAIGHSQTPYSRINGCNATLWANSSNAVELISIEAADNSEEGKIDAGHPQPNSPKPSFPWFGAAALVSIVLLTVAAVSVLLASSGSPIDQ